MEGLVNCNVFITFYYDDQITKMKENKSITLIAMFDLIYCFNIVWVKIVIHANNRNINLLKIK